MKKKTKWLALILSMVVLVESAGINVSAADITAADITAGDISGSDIIENVIMVTSGDVSGGEGMNNVCEEQKELLFPGLPNDYVLSENQIEAKAELALYTENIDIALDDGEEQFYVAGEVVCLASDEAEAQLITEAFGGTLRSFELGVAVICLGQERTVKQAVMAAADESVLLPAVWPNYYRSYCDKPNDPAMTEETDDKYQWQHKYVGSFYAWDAGYTGKGVRVGIIDSAILGNHEEFEGRIVKNVSLVDKSEEDRIAQGHGSHVTGVIAANKDNGVGGAGIAPEASVYAYDVFGDGEYATSAAVCRAINQAIADDVDIINMSIGDPTYSGMEAEVVKCAYNSGIALFAPAGNEASNGAIYPGFLDNVCMVAALQQDGAKAGFSNYNNSVDLAFPGVSIYSTDASGENAYTWMSGTSMACSVASGVAAVILSAGSDVEELANKTGTERVDALYEVMVKYAKASLSDGMGAGTTYLPDALNVVVEDWDSIPEKPSFDIPSGSVIQHCYTDLQISCGNNPAIDIYYSTDGKTPVYKNGVIKNGKIIENTDSIEIGSRKGEVNKVTVKAVAVNRITGKSSEVSTATYEFKPNAFYVQLNSNAGKTVIRGKSIQLTATITPANAVSKKVKWDISKGGKEAGVSVNQTGKITTSKTAVPGEYTVTATVVDEDGKTVLGTTGKAVSEEFIFTVKEEPVVAKVSFSEKKIVHDVQEKLDLWQYVSVTYKDGTVVTGADADVSWSVATPRIVDVFSNGKTIIIASGTTKVTAKANDGSNKSATLTLTIKSFKPQLKISAKDGLYTVGSGVSKNIVAEVRYLNQNKLTWTVTPNGSNCSGTVKIKNGKLTSSSDARGVYTITASGVVQDTYETRMSEWAGETMTASCTITIVPRVTQITVPKTMNLYVPNQDKQISESALNAVVVGGNTSVITYSSSNKKVATVDANGMVCAVGSGTAVITCKAMDGSKKTASCKVTVSVPHSSLQIVPGDNNNGIMHGKYTIKLKAVLGSSYGTPTSQTVKWWVDDKDKDVISVSQKGVVKGSKLAGTEEKDRTVTVYAQAADGTGPIANYKVLIRPAIVKLELEKKESDVYIKALNDVKNKSYVSDVDYMVTVGAVDGYVIGVRKGCMNGEQFFGLYPNKATTDKTGTDKDEFTDKDGIQVKVTVMLRGSNKKAVVTYTVIRTKDDKYFIL